MCTCILCIIYIQVHSWNDDPQRSHIFIESNPFSKRCRACRDLSEKDGWAMCVHVFCVWCGRKWDRDSLANVEHVCPNQSCSGGCLVFLWRCRCANHSLPVNISLRLQDVDDVSAWTLRKMRDGNTRSHNNSLHRPDAYWGRKDLAQALYSVYEMSSAIE